MNAPAQPKERAAQIRPESIRSEAEARKAVKALREAIRYHDHRYYILDSPVTSDAEYDRLMESLKLLEEKFPRLRSPESPTQRVGTKPRQGMATIKHPFPMLSLKSVQQEKEVIDFDKFCRRAAGGKTVEYVAEPKYDGLSVELIYEKGRLAVAATRGDGETGEDITRNMQTLKEVPVLLKKTKCVSVPRRLVLRGEVFMRKDEFKKLNERLVERGEEAFANPRNAAAGSLRQLDPKVTAQRPLHIFLYEVVEADGRALATQEQALEALSSWGLKVNEEQKKVCRKVEEALAFHDRLQAERDALLYEIDGVVFKINDRELQQKLGFRTREPRWALAYKFPPLQATSVLSAIEVQVGRTGRLTPVAVLTPVGIGGVTVSRASLHNESEIVRKDIHIRDTVLVERAGDVIPHVVKVTKTGSHRRQFQMPSQCPVCGGRVLVSEDRKDARCTNASCSAQLLGRIIHFASRKAMDIAGLGEEHVMQLLKAGLIKNVASIYDLKREDFLSLEGLAEKSADNLVRAIAHSKQNTLSRFIYGLGIPRVGEHMAQVLARNFMTIEGLVDATEKKLRQTEGVGAEAAHSIATFFAEKENRELICQMRKAGVKLNNPDQAKGFQPLQGRTIVFTGSLQRWSRSEAQKLVEELGGHAASSISNETDYVVAGPGAGSKLDEAQKRSIRIIDEAEFARFLAESPVDS